MKPSEGNETNQININVYALPKDVQDIINNCFVCKDTNNEHLPVCDFKLASSPLAKKRWKAIQKVLQAAEAFVDYRRSYTCRDKGLLRNLEEAVNEWEIAFLEKGKITVAQAEAFGLFKNVGFRRDYLAGRKYLSAVDILKMKNVPQRIPAENILTVVLREELIPLSVLDMFACWCAEQALEKVCVLGHKPSPIYMWGVEMKRRWLKNEITEEELDITTEEVNRELKDELWVSNSDFYKAYYKAAYTVRLLMYNSCFVNVRKCAMETVAHIAWHKKGYLSAVEAAIEDFRRAQIDYLLSVLDGGGGE